MIPVKICGITNTVDAQLAVRLGAAAVGMIFFEASPRYVTPDQAQKIVAGLDGAVTTVGIFVNEPPDRDNAVVAEVGLNLVQLSGDESPEDCVRITVPVIKTLHIAGDFDAGGSGEYDVRALLLDNHRHGSYGGTGQAFDWQAIDGGAFQRPVILSGGLHAGNILKGIATLAPDAVDIGSGVEAAPGRKDPDKLADLFAALKSTRATDAVVF